MRLIAGRSFPTHSSIRKFSTKSGPPLRILFCGSDDFSIASLRKLVEEQQTNPDLIASIDVVCKVGKPSGRGRKKIRAVPIKRVAEEAGLQVHEIPTFTGWQPPTRDGGAINLVIAVSFGLLVPPRILAGATYGGLNVHPSLLPALRGPAPLQHTILQDLKHSGITLQTLHPKHFDRGKILARTFCDLDAKSKSSFETLQSFMAPRAADLLIKGLREGIFIPPLELLATDLKIVPSEAPKITPLDGYISWIDAKAEEIMRKQRACGHVWSLWPKVKTDSQVRIKWHDLEKFDDDSLVDLRLGYSQYLWQGTVALQDEHDNEEPAAGMCTADGVLLQPRAITVEGEQKEQPVGGVAIVKKLGALLGHKIKI